MFGCELKSDRLKSRPVTDQVLIGELERRIHAPQELEDLQTVQRPVERMDRLEDLDPALAGRLIPLLDRQPGAQ